MAALLRRCRESAALWLFLCFVSKGSQTQAANGDPWGFGGSQLAGAPQQAPGSALASQNFFGPGGPTQPTQLQPSTQPFFANAGVAAFPSATSGAPSASPGSPSFGLGFGGVGGWPSPQPNPSSATSSSPLPAVPTPSAADAGAVFGNAGFAQQLAQLQFGLQQPFPYQQQQQPFPYQQQQQPHPYQQQQQQQQWQQQTAGGSAPALWNATASGGAGVGGSYGSSHPSILSSLGTGQTEGLLRQVADCVTPSQSLPTQDWEQGACVSAYTVASLTNDAVQNLKWGYVEITCSPPKQETTFVLQSVPRFSTASNPFKLIRAAARRFAQSRDVMVYKRPVAPACECIEGDQTNFFSVGFAKEQYLHSIRLRTSPARKYLFFPKMTNCSLPELPGTGTASKIVHVGDAIDPAEVVFYTNEVQPIAECFFKIAIKNPTAVIGTRRHVIFAFDPQERPAGGALLGGIEDAAAQQQQQQAAAGSATASKLLLPRRCFMSSPVNQLLVWTQEGILRPRGGGLAEGGEERVEVFYVFARGDELLNRKQAPTVSYQQLLTHADFDLALKHGFHPQKQ